MTDTLRSYFTPQANAENAAAMSAYMKDMFPFFGIKSPERKEVIRQFWKENEVPPVEDLPAITRALWEQPEREFQYFGMELWEKYKKNWTESHIEEIEYMISHKSWWDTVDFLATHLVADYFQKFPFQVTPITQKWMASGNMWLQRSCILFQLNYKQKTDKELLYSFIIPLSTSKEFFIQKAIGWSLRQLAKREPETVQTFVANHPLMPLSTREALKHVEE